MPYVFKYSAEAAASTNGNCTCPPVGLAPLTGETESFRFVFEDCGPASFSPQAISSPQVLSGKSAASVCSYHSLSFYLDADKARRKHAYLRGKYPDIVLRVGTHLARGVLNGPDGIVTQPGGDSHFELFEDVSANLPPRFRVVECLV